MARINPARNPRRVAGPVARPPSSGERRIPEKIPVLLDEVEWRAIAAMLHAAATSTASSPAHTTLFNRLYQEVVKQGRVEITPLE
jgi:hypothetical protein